MTDVVHTVVAISANNALCDGAKVSIQPQPTVIHPSSIKNNLT